MVRLYYSVFVYAQTFLQEKISITELKQLPVFDDGSQIIFHIIKIFTVSYMAVDLVQVMLGPVYPRVLFRQND